MARLQIEFRGASTVVHLGDGTTTVGRSNRCTIHLPDPDLADVHFRIAAKGDGFRLKDDGSGAGTRVNGGAVFATSLTHGDVIEAGSLRCTFLSKKGIPKTGRSKTAPSSPSAAARPAADSRPAAARVVERRARAPEPEGKKRPIALIAIGVGGAILVAAVLMVLSKQKDAAEEAKRLLSSAETCLQQAEKQANSKPLAEAVANLERIRNEFGSSSAAADARRLGVRADQLQESLGVLDAADVALRGVLSPEQALYWIRKVAPLTDSAGAAIRARIEVTLDQLHTAQHAKAEAQWVAANDESRTQERERKFGAARSAWIDYRTDDALCRRRADEALVALDARASVAYRGLLQLAGKAKKIDGRIGLLEASRPTFYGTPQANDLEVRISALHARKRQAQYLVVAKKETADSTKRTDKTRGPSGPYIEPDKVAELVKERKYAAAAALLQSISRHPTAKIRIEELTLQAALFSDLAAKAKSSPATFSGVLLSSRLGRANAIGADETGLRVALDGKPRAFSWQELPAKSYVKMFRQAGFHKPIRLAVALFFDDETLIKEAAAAYVDFFESEQAPTTFTRIYSHRLGIAPPDGGFVLFRKKLLTPPQRDRILLAERIAKLVKDASRASDARRDVIWTELETLGAPAQEALAGSIRGRRSDVVVELRKSNAF
jgi:hypothetical protein